MSDEDRIRELGRLAAGGGAADKLAYARARAEAGLAVDPWELEPLSYVFLEAFERGPDGRVEAVRTEDDRAVAPERFYVVPSHYPLRWFNDPELSLAGEWPSTTGPDGRWRHFYHEELRREGVPDDAVPGDDQMVAAIIRIHLRHIERARGKGLIVLDRYLGSHAHARLNGHGRPHEGLPCYCQAQRFFVLSMARRPWDERPSRWDKPVRLPTPFGYIRPSDYSQARILSRRAGRWRNPTEDEARDLERRAKSGDREAVLELAAGRGGTLVGRVDGWTYTRSGYQVTTIDGVKYATTFDLGRIGLKPRDLVEWRPTGRRAHGYDLDEADIIRVVGHDHAEDERLVKDFDRELERVSEGLNRAYELALRRRRNILGWREFAEMVRDAMTRPIPFGHPLTQQRLVGPRSAEGGRARSGTLYEVVAIDERRSSEFRDRDEGDPVLTVAVRSAPFTGWPRTRARRGEAAIFDPLRLDLDRLGGMSTPVEYRWDPEGRRVPPDGWEPPDRVRAKGSVIRAWLRRVLGD